MTVVHPYICCADASAQANTTIAAAIAPAVCSPFPPTANEVALAASVSTASAPNSGHGGSAHSG